MLSSSILLVHNDRMGSSLVANPCRPSTVTHRERRVQGNVTMQDAL